MEIIGENKKKQLWQYLITTILPIMTERMKRGNMTRILIIYSQINKKIILIKTSTVQVKSKKKHGKIKN